MSSLASGGSLAGLARVAFESTGVGEVTRDIDRVEHAYRSGTQSMSDAAIKVELAQNRLQRTLRRGPAAYREQAAAELQLRNAEEALRRETLQLDRAQDQAQRGLGKFGRGALAGSGAFRSLGRSVAFASAGFLGGAGLVAGVTKAISVASNLDEQTNKVNVTFREGGRDVIAWSHNSAVSFGIAQDKALEYAGTIGGIFNASGLARSESAKLSQQIVQLAADMASFNNASPEEALDALRSGLVGESEPLRRYQVLLTEANVAQEAMRETGKKSATQLTQGEKILARYHLILQQTTDQQGDFARTSDGLANSQRQLAALWRDTEGILGQALLPAYKDVVQGLRDWLAEDENRKRLQRDINAVVTEGEKVVRGFAGALKVAKDVAEPLSNALGGTERSAKLLLEAIAVYKLAKIAAGVRGIALAFGLVGPAATKAAAEAVIAENAIGTAAVVNAGRVGVLGRALGFGLSTAGITTALLAGGDIVSRGSTKGQNDLHDYPRLYQVFLKILGKVPLTKKEREAWKTAIGGNLVTKTGRTNASESQLQRGEAMLAKGTATTFGGAPVVPGSHPGQGGRPQTTRTTDGDGEKQGAQFTFARFEAGIAALQESELDAAATPGQADDVRVAKRRLALARRALRELKLTREQRIQVKQERNRALQEIAAIEQQEDQAAAQVSADRMARIRQREATLINRVEAAKLTKKLSDDRAALRNLIAFYREESKNMDIAVSARQAFQKKRIQTLAKLKALDDDDSAAVDKAVKQAQSYYDRMNKALGKHDFSTRAGLRAAALKYVDASGKPKTGAGLTEADVRRLQFDFLAKLTGEIGQWGSNFQSDDATTGQMATNSHVQTQLMQRQTFALLRLIEGSWHAGAQLSSAELSAAGWGVGF